MEKLQGMSLSTYIALMGQEQAILDRKREMLVKLFEEEAKEKEEQFTPEQPPSPFQDMMNFSGALDVLKAGGRVARLGWNGKGIFIELQTPGSPGKMTGPYIYIDTTGLETDNFAAQKSVVPWLATQTDMLANDWVDVLPTS